MSNSLFSSSEYVLYRFEYPENLFQPLRSWISPSFRHDALQVLDLGCGTGLVTESFLRFYPHALDVTLLDPDQEMLDQAKAQFHSHLKVSSIQCASSESIPFSDERFDLVLIGSAWHWMNQELSVKEIERVLKPNGLVFIFEYQFPKGIELPELNDWIRLRFNSDWKPSLQTPRGSLKELTECWRGHSQFSQVQSVQVTQNRMHHAKELAGVIVSQSRYQHYEQTLPESKRLEMRAQLESSLDEWLGGGVGKFSYYYEGYFFKKRV